MTKSAGQIGLILSGFPFKRLIASRIAAKSTTAGTPVKSLKNGQVIQRLGVSSQLPVPRNIFRTCRITLAGLKGTSTPSVTS